MDIFTYLEQHHHMVLTPRQQESVKSDADHVLLLAVPGAGKTTALVSRVARLIAEGQPADSLLNLTFNRESARDMQRRWTALFGDFLPQAPAFSTIHSFCFRLLREHADRRGTQVPQLLTDGGQKRIITGLWQERTGSYLADDRLEELTESLGYAANMLMTDSELQVLDREVSGLRSTREGYEQYKRREHLMDFDDMLRFALEILRRFPQTAETLRCQYSYLHLDEAQDTSRLQHEIIRAIAPSHLFMVGDEDQSIYRFRGAYPRALLEFPDQYPGAAVLKLEENFRSTPQIIAAASGFISQNHQRYDKTMLATRDAGKEIVYTVLPELSSQYDYAGDRLAALPAGSTAAVLYRGGLSAAAMADQLLRRDIPFSIRERRFSLTKDVIVRDVMAFLRLALDPGDGQAFLSVYYRLGCYLNRELAERVVRMGEPNLFTALIEGDDYPGKSTARLSFVSAVFRNMAKKTPVAAVDKILWDLDYLDHLQSRGEGGYTDEVAAQRLGALRSIADGCATVADFLERLTVLDEQINQHHQPDAAITLSTVHSAKGQEFDRVLIIDLLEGVFPTAQAIEERATGLEDGMEEEARLFYVAVTRARDNLELITAQKLGNMQLLPSRFLERLRCHNSDDSLTRQLQELGLRRGARVAHPVFGFGTVDGVNRITGDFTVHFPKVSPKTFGLDSLDEGGLLKLI